VGKTKKQQKKQRKSIERRKDIEKQRNMARNNTPEMPSAHTTEDFSTGIGGDIIKLITVYEQFKFKVKSRIEFIENIQNEIPGKFENIYVEPWIRMRKVLAELGDQSVELARFKGHLDDLSTNEEKMVYATQNFYKLTEFGVAVEKIRYELEQLERSFTSAMEKIRNPMAQAEELDPQVIVDEYTKLRKEEEAAKKQHDAQVEKLQAVSDVAKEIGGLAANVTAVSETVNQMSDAVKQTVEAVKEVKEQIKDMPEQVGSSDDSAPLSSYNSLITTSYLQDLQK